ncbi:hypothetical protein NC652_031589 [Populus alba x Populus x berolinensis]|nr:hypothetical protein NC652_031589 [Populus alba x Populus x berolinensis]
MLLPLLGAFIADSFLGRYRTIVVASCIYILGLSLLTLSAVLPSSRDSGCQTADAISLCSPDPRQVILFFVSLYIVAIGQGGHKPCVQAFGADQFDGKHPEESKAKSSFFNWWYFSMNSGMVVALLILNYIQDNLNWGLGFGIPCIIMVGALIVFLLGTKTYRYGIKTEERSAFLRIGQVFVEAVRNWRANSSAIDCREEALGIVPHQCSEQFKFLNKALLTPNSSKEDGKVCSIGEVEEAKAVLRLVPIWTTCLIYGIVFAQSSTFFTKQGATMDRSISPGLDLPAASLQSLIYLSIVFLIPFYDRVLVPTARALTRKPSGISMLQRIGTGILLSALSMVLSAVVEMKRLRTAREYGLVDLPNTTIPMSVCWLVPQYILYGAADVFAMVGLQEFFYDQVPSELRSVGLSLYLSIFGVGSFLSSFLISGIEKATGRDGHDSWFANNLNRAHLDYFYWLLAGLSGLSLLTLSAVLPSVRAYDCQSADTIQLCSPDPSLILFFVALYLVAFGQGGFRPCVQAFGADQFDGQDPEERKSRSSFFNWWNFGMSAGVIVILPFLNYIQDNLNWGFGFGIPCVVMAVSLVIFLLGTKMYRYSIRREEEHPFLRIGRVLVKAIRNWRISPAVSFKEDASCIVSRQNSEQFEFLNKALLEISGSEDSWMACTPREVEEAKAVLRLVPIWTSCLIFATVGSQVGTFFTKQARTMNRSISERLEFPAASIQLSIPLAIVVLVPIYDRVFVPVARRLTGEHSGITMLQRIGTGLFSSVLAMAVAALVEMKRLKTAEEHGLVDMPNVTIPMSGWWLIPQLVLLGAADVFTIIGLQEFFYDQVPSELKSVGLALFLSVLGVGNFLSGFLISIIDKTTGKDGDDSWFANNLNRAHLDYFYWILAVLSVVQLVAFLVYVFSTDPSQASPLLLSCKLKTPVTPTIQSPLLIFSDSMGAYKYVSELWRKKQSDVMRFLQRVRCWEYRQHPSIVRVTHPTRPDKARRLGYKAKQGYVVYRIRVRRGGRKRPVPKGIVYGKPTNQGVTQLKFQRSKRSVAEERAGRKLGGLRVLNSYWINEDSTYKYFEVILVDVAHNAIRNDPRINWLCNPVHKHRELRGLTSAGKKYRGLRGRGHLHHKARPSRRANWKRNNTLSLRRYR